MSTFLAFFQQQDPPATEAVTVTEPVSGLTGIVPLDQVLNTIIAYTPKILGAILILILAWVVATLVRMVVRKGMAALKVDDKLSSAGSDSGSQVVKTLSDVVFWIVFILFVPAILGVLGMTGVLGPLNIMMSNVLGYLPNILGAALIFVLGMLVANIVRQLVTSFLGNVGLNKFAEDHSIKTDFTKGGLAGLIGTIVYALILLAVLSAALSTLKIDAISRPIEGVINPILGSIPNIFGAAILLIIAYLVGKIIRGLVTDILAGLGFNKIPGAIGLSNLPTEGERSASAFVGHLAFLAIMFYAVIESAKILNFELLALTVAEIARIGGRIIGGIVILAIGMYVANIVANLIKESGVSNASLLATVARVSILFFVGAMALNQMGVAYVIVGTAFSMFLGALAVAFAIAFGVGGIDFAKQTIADVSSAVRENKSAPPVKSDPPAGDDNPLDA